jgi:hypothetical protein
MPELIDRQAVRLLESDADAYTENWNDGYEKGFCDAINKVLELPTIESEPVRRGRWMKIEPSISLQSRWKCSRSKCGGIVHAITDYCPYCGARMDATDTNVGKGGNG